MIVPERTLPRVGQVTLALGTEFQVPLRADGETGLHDLTSFPAFLEPTSLRGPGAPLLSPRSCGVISHHGGRPRLRLCRGISQKLPSSWQCVGSRTKAMCKSPIKSLSCSPPSSNGPHGIIYVAQVGKTSSLTQGHKAQGLLVLPQQFHGPQAGTGDLPSCTCFQSQPRGAISVL